MKKRKFIKSAEEDQFEIDESIIDEVSNAEEFADVEVTEDDIMDAVQAIEALADAVIEKANVEEKEIDADALLDEVRDMIDETHEEEPEEDDFSEEEELPEELVNSAVRVMVSEEGAVEVEQSPDEVYDDTLDGLECTVFDTCDDVPLDVEDDAPNAGDDVLVIGNSKSNKYKKGFVVLKSSANKKAWSAAYKKVKKMVGSSKLTAAHWVIVSALAKKEEEKDKLKKKIECKLIKTIRSNKETKAKFCGKFLKSSEEFEPNGGATDPENKPEDTTGEGNPGYQEEGKTENMNSPEQIKPEDVTNNSGDKTEKLDAEGVDVPNEPIIVVDVPLTNSKKKVRMEKIASRLDTRGYNLYRIVKSTKELETLNGKVIKCGKVGFAFKNTTQGIMCCVAPFVSTGKGSYKPVIKNNKVVISTGKMTDVFSSAEKVIIAKKIASARIEGRKEAIRSSKAEAIRSARRAVRSAASRRPVRSSVIRQEVLNNPARKPVTSAARRPVVADPARRPSRPVTFARRPAPTSPVRRPVVSAAQRETLNARRQARQAIQSANIAKRNEAQLRSMHEAEERQRLFQSSQRQISEEKQEIKSNNSRNAETLAKMYDRMF